MTRIFSGIKPTGHLTPGNPVGAVHRWVGEGRYRAAALFGVVDLGAVARSVVDRAYRAVGLVPAVRRNAAR